MRKRLLSLVAVLAVLLLSAGIAFADSILFPYINSNKGNVSTLISVITASNTANLGCNAGERQTFHFYYNTKVIDPAKKNPDAACVFVDFFRPTTENDIVTFDVAGGIGGGKALFDDTTNYEIKPKSNYFDLPNLGYPEVRRGYLAVNHACEYTDKIADDQGSLDGEAMIVDVVSGAAWGYRAVVSDDATLPAGWFTEGDLANAFTGSTTDRMVEQDNRRVALYPDAELKTRFFVTPLMGYVYDAATDSFAADGNMLEVASARPKWIQVRSYNGVGQQGYTLRDEEPKSNPKSVDVQCVAGIDLGELFNNDLPPDLKREGGWINLNLRKPGALIALMDLSTTPAANFESSAIVWKLEFGTPSFAAGVLNNATLIRHFRFE